MRTLLFVYAIAGCAHQYAYVPTAPSLTQINGQTAAVYAVPPEAPRGDVRVASFGINQLRIPGDGELPALHIRVMITNRDSSDWLFDSREQLCDIAGEGRSRTIFSSADREGLPVLAIAPNSTRTIDLFYPLPAGIDRARRLPEFSLLWKIQAGREIAMRTPFDRVAVEVVAYADGYYGPGWWGPYGWYDPLYVEFRFIHPFPLPPYFPGPRIVGPPPPHFWPHPPVRGPHPPVIVRPPPPRFAPRPPPRPHR